MPAARRVERRPPAFVPVPGELEVIALTRHADDNAPDPEPAAEEGAEGSDEGRGAGRAIAPGAGGEHGEEDVAAMRPLRITGRKCHGYLILQNVMMCFPPSHPSYLPPSIR